MYYFIPRQFRKISFTAFLAISFLAGASPSFVSAKNQEESAEDYRLKGYEQQNKGNFAQALEYYTKALSLGKANAAFLNDIGVVSEQLGNQLRAEESYRKAIELDPQYLPPYTNLAYFYKGIGRLDLAAPFFEERYWRAAPQDPWKRRALDELLEINPKYKQKLIQTEAEQMRRELVAKAHEEFAVELMRSGKHYQQGRKYLADKQYKLAISEFDRALSLTPDNPRVVKAKEDAVLAMDMEDIKRRAGKAIETLDAGEIEKARKQFQEILATIPEDQNKISGK